MIKQDKISSIEVAYKVAGRIITESGSVILNIIPINQSRYAIIKTDKENYLLTFKREMFFNFGKMFKELGKKGIGDSINKEDIKTAVSNNVRRIFTIFPNAHIYSISMEDFLNNSVDWINKEGKELKSISIHEYVRID